MFQHVAQAVVFTKFAVIQAHAKLQSFANVSCAHTFAGDSNREANSHRLSGNLEPPHGSQRSSMGLGSCSLNSFVHHMDICAIRDIC